jgi:HEAT repeat protein
MMSLIFALLLGGQDADAWIERLRSDHPDVREEAAERLLELAEAARASLEKAKDDPNVEVAARSRDILSRLNVRASLGSLTKVMPELDRKLAGASDAAWTRALLDATHQKGSQRRHPSLKREDVDVLAVRAIQGAAPDEIVSVCKRVADWGLVSAGPALTRWLSHPDLDVRREVVRGLGLLDARSTLKEVAAALKTERNAWTRSQLVGLVGRWGGPEAIPDLWLAVRAAETNLGDDFIMSAALDALGRLGSPEDFPKLLSLKRQWIIYTREIAQALCRIDAEKAVEFLVKEIESSRENDRWDALHTLLEMRSTRVIPAARKLLKNPDSEIRGKACGALHSLQAKEAIPDLKILLADPSPWNRKEAVHALAFLGDPSARPALIALLDEPGMIESTVHSLSRVDAREALPRLLDLFRAGDPRLAIILARQGGPEWVGKMLPLPENAPRSFRVWTAASLAGAGYDEAAPLLISLLRDAQQGELGHLPQALGRMGRRDALQPLIDASKKLPGPPRYLAFRYFGRSGGKEAIPYVAPFLDAPDPTHRREALISLEEAGASEYLPSARNLLSDAHMGVAAQAAAWLARTGSAEGVPVLLASTGIHRFALNALRRPQAWAKLKAVRFPRPHYAEGARALEELARAAGFSLQFPENGERVIPDFVAGLHDVLEALASSDVVLEDASLHVLSPLQAERFWRDWWASRLKDAPLK